MVVVAAARGDDHEGVALHEGRGEQDGPGLAAAPADCRQLEDRHPGGLVADAATGDREEQAVCGVHALEHEIMWHEAEPRRARPR
ncbi:hypothetical protein GCM10023215_05570 [Pseudonocardia yuanmonensis]|uniref:Uncharacterized protein n=1 Tax=Pseudonocardia yuanmonensis TaxID=1095914 RepID=A0ABP8VZ39_9PSEU